MTFFLPSLFAHPVRSRVLSLTLAGCAFCAAVFYAYLINATVGFVVSREQREHDAAALHAVLALREAAYIARMQEITLERAYALGFVDAREVVFVKRADGGITLNAPVPEP